MPRTGAAKRSDHVVTTKRKKKRGASEPAKKRTPKAKADKAETLSAGSDPGTIGLPERRSTYTPQLGQQICMRVAMGETLHGISLDPTMPPNSTMHEWRSIHKDFAVNYARAREARADARSDKIDRLIDQMLKGEIRSDVARVAIDALKWQAGREMPKRYGDKIVSEHVGRDGGPIETMEARDKVKDHLEGLSKRFAEGLKFIDGGVPAQAKRAER
jgi:hypothetical protein